MGIGAAVVGFDAGSRAWATESDTAEAADGLPRLDGTLLTDPAALAPYAEDFGHLVTGRTPRAVLLPGSVADIAAMIRFCGPRGIEVAPRGQGHQGYGQAQVEAGLVIDMGPLNAITVDPGGRTVSVQAGAVWSAVLTACLAHGLTPPVFTDYIELSVGGTLSLGGLGGAAHHHGAQVDTVVELDVVTGTGDVVTCSPTRHADLFHAARAGLGQVGVITRAVLTLVPAHAGVRKYTLTYTTLSAFVAAQRRTVRDGRFDWLEGAVAAAAGGGWQFQLEGAVYFDATAPDDQALIGDLGGEGSPRIEEFDYQGFVDDLAPAIAYLKSTGEWYDPHPWFEMFLSDEAVESSVGATLATLTPADIGASGLILLYPVPTARLRAPMLRVPDSELAFLFAVLRTAAPDADARSAAEMLAANRALLLKGQAVGGTVYPGGAIPMTGDDWRLQYGDQWSVFQAAKRRFDPHGILTPGQEIFPRG
ncbi:FAD-binding protein [Catenulispora subtropica]|uniref:FAD-binding protein n=1 Tax=Catenulispora subtropica TaxID=450798 RepID=UPI0031CFF10C